MARPLSFCPDAALDRALEVFWRNGYEGASLADLTEAMGINRPSLYAVFGNKEALFHKALERYTNIKSRLFDDALSAPTSREAMERLLMGAAEMMTDPGSPVGCLAVQGALSCSDSSEPVRQEMIRIRAGYETRLCEYLEKEKAKGGLPADADPEDLARFVSAIANGMSVEATGGATYEQLQKVVKNALKAWPV